MLVDFGKNIKRPQGMNYGHIFSAKYLRRYNKKPLNNLAETRASTVSPILYFGESANHQRALFHVPSHCKPADCSEVYILFLRTSGPHTCLQQLGYLIIPTHKQDFYKENLQETCATTSWLQGTSVLSQSSETHQPCFSYN